MIKKSARAATFFLWLWPICMAAFYLVTHFWNLTALPVFADEAIYIRWAQLIMDDAGRYLFFAMNDGKTPLFIWLLIPFQYFFADQLFAARFVSVVVGLFQLLVIQQIVKKLGGRRTTQYFAMLLTAMLPFWFFYHRMALMDSLLTLFLSLTLWGSLHLVQPEEKPSAKKSARTWKYIALTGLSYGLAFWTKLPALFFLPIFPLLIFFPVGLTLKKRLQLLFPLGVAAGIGMIIFATLRISPIFGQLFHRGSDFTYPIGDVLFHGVWQTTLAQIPTYATYFLQYFTWPVLLISLSGLFSNRLRRTNVFLWLATLAFAAPFVIFGKVIYARYFLPCAIFLTVSCALSLQAIYDHWLSERNAASTHPTSAATSTKMSTKLILAPIVAILIANIISNSAMFMITAITNPNALQLVGDDPTQYLEEWSSGHGIVETVNYIREQSHTHSIAVATEGRFGTLPDGLLLYFHRTNVDNIYIEGTEEYPVKDIPDFFKQRAQKYNQSILVVNSHRMELHSPDITLLHEYCRPNNAPCLQIWDITKLVKR